MIIKITKEQRNEINEFKKKLIVKEKKNNLMKELIDKYDEYSIDFIGEFIDYFEQVQNQNITEFNIDYILLIVGDELNNGFSLEYMDMNYEELKKSNPFFKIKKTQEIATLIKEYYKTHNSVFRF